MILVHVVVEKNIKNVAVNKEWHYEFRDDPHNKR